MHVCAHNTGVWLKHPGRQVRETSFMVGETDLDTNKHRPVSVEKGTSAEKGCLHCCKVKLKKTPHHHYHHGFPVNEHTGHWWPITARHTLYLLLNRGDRNHYCSYY